MAHFTYKDGRYYRDGEPFFVISVEYQYYRDRRGNWRDRLEKLFASGANVVNFYIPWRHHLIVEGANWRYDFSGTTRDNRDLIEFLQVCSEVGFYIIAKPGPFVHSELNIGGLPDIASPSYNGEIEPVRVHDGKPLLWDYDDKILPSPCDAGFDEMVEEWLEAVAVVLRPHVSPIGKLIGIQLNDETIYCTSNAAPWTFGYDEPCLQFFRGCLHHRYGEISAYNVCHGSDFTDFSEIPAPQLPRPGGKWQTPQELIALVDWADFQWRLRRENYSRYREYLGLELPYLTNYAGITPPIEENVPGKNSVAREPDPFAALYSEWWFAMNRIEADLDVYEYGMISWLGVAAYNIADPRSCDHNRDCSDNEVFHRYINTARRRRGINMEENWGFATLYHPFSKYPLVPFFQTLASVAGGCTGYVVFCGVQHDYWDEDLDSVTKKQHPTFPSDAPITADGELTPMYQTMKMMNEWFAREGRDYLCTELTTDLCWLLYAPYAAVSGWVPGADYWQIEHAIPRCSVEGFEPFSRLLQRHGYTLDMLDLQASTADMIQQHRVCAIRLAFFLDAASQQQLLDYVESGGILLCSGELPRYDERMAPCSLLADRIGEGHNAFGKGSLYYFPAGDFFSDQRSILALGQIGIEPKVNYSDYMRAFIYRNERDHYIWFFNFETAPGPHRKHIEFYGKRLELTLGSKTAGVVHLRGEDIVSILAKGKNEVEGVETEIGLGYGGQKLQNRGDWLYFSG